MNTKLYAVKMNTVFGTYTMFTTPKKEEADEYAAELKEKGRGSVRVVEVDGYYNGSIKLA